MTHRNFKQSLTTPEKERTELREQKCSEMQTTDIDFKITQDTSTHTNQMPSSWLFYGDDPLILSACEPFLSLLLLRHPSLACSDLDQLSSPWWPTWYAILPCGSGSPSGYCLLLLLFTLLCALWFSPGPAWLDIWSCFSLVLASAVDLFFHP